MSFPRTRQRPSASNTQGSLVVTRKTDGFITTYDGPPKSWVPEVTGDHLSPLPFLTAGNFESVKIHWTACRVNGSSSNATEDKVFSDFAAYASTQGSKDFTLEDLTFWSNYALAKVNPYVPLVDLPAELADGLLDLVVVQVRFLIAGWRTVFEEFSKNPRKWARNSSQHVTQRARSEYRAWNEAGGMAKSVGVAGSAGTGALFYYFFLRPLLGLVDDLRNLAESIDRRRKELKNRPEHLHLELVNTFSSVSEVVSLPISHLNTYSTSAKRDFSERVWCEANFYMSDPPFPELGDMEIQSLARTRKLIALGLTGKIGFDTLWEALPFSWLVDYFVQVGTFLQAHRGKYSYGLSQYSICATSSFSRTIESPSGLPSGLSVTPGLYTVNTKRRDCTSILKPEAAFANALSEHEQNILLSMLAVIAKGQFGPKP